MFAEGAWRQINTEGDDSEVNHRVAFPSACLANCAKINAESS